MPITYKNSISADEVNFLRASAGFRQILPEQISAGLKGSALVVAAYDNEHIAGMARLIWDSGMVALITDVIVLPKYQELRIEDEMIIRILDYLKSKLKSGFGIQVDVHAWGNQERLYESLGFRVSSREQRGVLMHICLTEQIELTDSKFKQCEFCEKDIII